MPKPRYYWDANVFIKLISNLMDAEAVEERRNCELFFRDARDGKVDILTSTLTRVEVLDTEENLTKPVPQRIRDQVISMFDEPYITSILLDPARSSEARDLRWEYQWLKTADAVHIASAIYAKVDIMHTYDGRTKVKGILSLDGAVGNPPLKISVPRYEGELHLFPLRAHL